MAYEHIDKKSGDGLAITDWNTLSSAVAGNSGLHLAVHGADKVGIGTTSPGAKLDVAGDINAAGPLSFGQKTQQTLNLWDTVHGIGVQANTTYFRSSRAFAWYKGGKHNDGMLDAGGGTAQMVIDNGNVGIGTTSPSQKLEVNGTVKATKFIGDGSGLTNLSVGLTGLNLATQSGNVGIGTSNPLTPLHVVARSEKMKPDITRAFAVTTNDPYSASDKKNNPFGLDIRLTGAATLDKRAVYIQSTDFNYQDGGNILLQPAAGNVGIGTTSPTQKLEVNGTVKAAKLKIGDWEISAVGTELHFTKNGELQISFDGGTGRQIWTKNNKKNTTSGWLNES